MMIMMDSSKKSGKPNNVQDNSSSTSQASISNPTSPGSIQSTATAAAAAAAAASSKPPSMESWPPSLKQYVEEVFNNCIPDRRDEAENELRRLILEKHREGTLMTLDWSNMDLPLACGSARFRKTLKTKQGSDRYPYQNTSPNHGVTTFSSSRKRKDYHGIQGLDQEDEKRQSRQRRFQLQAESPRNRVAIGLQMMDINKHDSIIGTSQMLEKNYFRLTSAPDPATVRPPKVLKKTLELLKTKWRDEQNYTYICDQFKSMRQDLTVQRIRDEFTVTVYEIHARIALEKGDLGEYNQCQSQLKQLYAMGINGNVMEFTAYRILYYLHTQNWSDINSIMFELTAEQKQNDLVKHALQVRSALSTSNYHRFFKLYVSAPQMGGYLMDQFVERERVRAMLILCKAYRPTMSLEFIQNELAFERQEDLLKFLKSHDASILTQDKKSLDTKLASRFFGESSKQFKKIDIKGQL
ncbi:SAC3/GANP/Nin1/mts3/eIF-3 p25 family-domain-containing protein [Circinella umbellata]|nr:SAC3/GANP/Nin1/mts3/eIF-3 p25 family-domain-containing protein [Circinella umbellata]